MSVLNFYKINSKSTCKYTLFGRNIKNIEFLQTFIVHLSIVYSDMKISKISFVKLLKK